MTIFHAPSSPTDPSAPPIADQSTPENPHGQTKKNSEADNPKQLIEKFLKIVPYSPIEPEAVIEDTEGMCDDDIFQYPFLLPEMITDDNVLYRRKLQEVVDRARTGLIEMSRAQIFTELRNSSDQMMSKYNETLRAIFQF